LKNAAWPVREFLRQALLAYSYRAEGRAAEFSEAWKTAVIAAGSDPMKAKVLLARVVAWKWGDERFDVVAKLFQLTPGDKPLRDALIAWETAEATHGKPESDFLPNCRDRTAQTDPFKTTSPTRVCCLIPISLARESLPTNSCAAPGVALLCHHPGVRPFKTG